MTHKNIDKLILFGGSRLLADFVRYAKRGLSYELIVYGSKRHLDEKIPGDRRTLRQVLEKERVKFFESPDINRDKNLKGLVGKKTLGIAFGAPWVFEKKTTRLFRPGYLLDFMGIDLPRYRGGAHYTWQILHQNLEGCANLQIIRGGKETLHRGEVIKRLEYDLPARVRRPIDYFNFMAKKELLFLKEFFRELRQNKNFKISKLNEAQSSYYPFLSTREQGFINWNWSGEQIARFINAFGEPYAGASTYFDSNKAYVQECLLLNAPERYHPFTAGLVVRKDKKGVYVAAVGALLHFRTVLDEKGKDVTRKIELGQRFYTPHGDLDRAMTFRAVYNAQGQIGGKKI